MEHLYGLPEGLVICAGRETVVMEGRDLAPIRAALDIDRVGELRNTFPSAAARLGASSRRILIEEAAAESDLWGPRRISHLRGE